MAAVRLGDVGVAAGADRVADKLDFRPSVQPGRLRPRAGRARGARRSFPGGTPRRPHRCGDAKPDDQLQTHRRDDRDVRTEPGPSGFCRMLCVQRPPQATSPPHLLAGPAKRRDLAGPRLRSSQRSTIMLRVSGEQQPLGACPSPRPFMRPFSTIAAEDSPRSRPGGGLAGRDRRGRIPPSGVRRAFPTRGSHAVAGSRATDRRPPPRTANPIGRRATDPRQDDCRRRGDARGLGFLGSLSVRSERDLRFFFAAAGSVSEARSRGRRAECHQPMWLP